MKNSNIATSSLFLGLLVAVTGTAEGACSRNPCLNGGVCEDDAGGGHLCSCESGYGGISCQTATSSLDDFFIKMDFSGTWTAAREAVFQDAADRWAEVITHVPCGGTRGYPAGRLLISATLETIDGTISLAGSMLFDIDDIDDMEDANIFESVILHEMGHVIGVGTLWGDCSTCYADLDPDWKCPSTIEVYNDLLGDPDGTEAAIIELDGGGGTACGHFDETIFDDELMTGYVDSEMYLSKITAASLDDTGYIVNATQVDPYTLPALRLGSSIRSDSEGHVMKDIAHRTRIGLVDEDGVVVGESDGIVMTLY